MHDESNILKSVYEIGTPNGYNHVIHHLRGATYRFTAYLGYDRNGKQIRKTTTFTPAAGLTQKKSDKLEKEEYINFCNRCKGLYTLKDITPAVVSHFFSNHKVMVKEQLQSLSPSTAKKIYTILQSMFSFAVSQGYIKETPCRNVILPKKSGMEEDKTMCLTIDELPSLLNMFKEYSSFNTIILALLYTGMRSGGCLGLQWEDIEFKNKKIHIHHTLSDVGGKHFLTTPKTKKSTRYQFMNETLISLLKKHTAEQRKLQMALGSDFSHPEMVFTSATGNYKDRSCLNTQFKRFLRGTPFEFMTLHKLRHTNATILLNSGVDLKIVSEHLGHSDITVTGDIYVNVLDNSRLQTTQKMEPILAEQTPNKHQLLGIG